MRLAHPKFIEGMAMHPIIVPDKFTADLQEIASREQRSLEMIVDEAINSYLASHFVECSLTAAQSEHLKCSLAQADKGELVSQEEVEAFFDDWEKEAASR